MSADAIRAEILSEYTQRLIRLKARQLSRRADFRGSDCEDLVQELTVGVLAHAHRYTADRSSPRTFIRCVLLTCVGATIRRQRRQRRLPQSGACVLSLTTMVHNSEDGDVELSRTISVEDLARRTGNVSLTDIELFDRRCDIDSVVEHLPGELRIICLRLRHESPTAVCRSLGISRGRMRDCLKIIRRHFELLDVTPSEKFAATDLLRTRTAYIAK